MPFRFCLVDYFFIGLVIRIAFWPTYIKEEFSKIEIGFLTSNAVHFYKSEFNNLVARIFCFLAGTKIFYQQVGIFFLHQPRNFFCTILKSQPANGL